MFALLLAVTAIMRLDIQPADKTGDASVLSNPSSSIQTPSAPPAENKDTANIDTPVRDEVPTAAPQINPYPEPSVMNPAPEETPDTPSATETPVEVTVTPESPDVTDVVQEPSPEPSPEPITAPFPLPEPNICTIEIRCDTVVDTSKLENQAVAPYVPADGVILAVTEMEFEDGESVFDILLRATREQDIHMEFRDDNMYSGKYIEGINYLYELDAGALSGWMYKVNEQFPNYGCAACKVKRGDAIVWIYTCDLGMDVGDNSIW